MLEITTVTYDTQYNEKLRPITGKQITTVEISPTGSGKSHFYRNSADTIMLFPTNSLVQQYNGLMANKYKKEGVKSDWKDMGTSKCDHMTYDKFLGHTKKEDISSFNIILDEAHLLLLSIEDHYVELVRKLLLREIEYRELKLISATLRPEVLDLYHRSICKEKSHSLCFDVMRYIHTSRELHINFVTHIPKITPEIKTLFFVNSKSKMIQVKEYYKSIYQNIRIAMISTSDEQRPNEEIFTNTDLIISTSLLQYGYSISAHIDRVIVHNVHNAVGAIGILQYVARPRNNQPEIFVVSASTHFKQYDLPNPFIGDLEKRVKGYVNSDDELAMNKALILNRFIAYAKQTQNKWKIAGVALYYEEMMKYYELYSVIDESEYGMAESMHQIMPGTTISYECNSDEEIDDIRFKKIDLDLDYEEYINIYDLRRRLDQITIESDDEKIVHKARTLSNLEPIGAFKLEDKKGSITYFKYTDAIQVRQVLEPKILARCKQHISNEQLYKIRDSGDPRDRIKIGDCIPVHFGGKLKRKLGFAMSAFKTTREPIRIAEDIYSFERYSDKECTKRLHDGQIARAEGIRIISLYPVENGWFEEISKEDYEHSLY
jgi:hypothetical protein